MKKTRRGRAGVKKDRWRTEWGRRSVKRRREEEVRRKRVGRGLERKEEKRGR